MRPRNLLKIIEKPPATHASIAAPSGRVSNGEPRVIGETITIVEFHAGAGGEQVRRPVSAPLGDAVGVGDRNEETGEVGVMVGSLGVRIESPSPSIGLLARLTVESVNSAAKVGPASSARPAAFPENRSNTTCGCRGFFRMTGPSATAQPGCASLGSVPSSNAARPWGVMWW